ncbi:hypothetical protein DRQ50_07015 [bacterium]|nr:MAG: hypothetical protein DRQ50_07015 [bacterium]
MSAAPMHAWVGFDEEQGARMRAAAEEVGVLAETLMLPATLYIDTSNSTGMEGEFEGRLDGRPYNAACFDIDKDGLKDLMLTQAPQAAWRTEHFDGNGTPYLEERTGEFFWQNGVPNDPYDLGTIYADFDNDGWTDIYVPNRGQTGHRLFRYNPELIEVSKNVFKVGGFEDVTTATGLRNLSDPSHQKTTLGSWVDYDGDGDVDLLINVHNAQAPYHSVTQVLLRNDPTPGGTSRIFTDVTAATGFVTSPHIGSTLWADFDGDSDLDIVMVDYGGPGSSGPHSSYQENKVNETGFFQVVTNSKLFDRERLNGDTFAAISDVDNDGDLDIVYTKGEIVGIFRNDNGVLAGDLETVVVENADPRDIDVFDFELDGRMDVTVSNSVPFPFLLRNNPDAVYAASFQQVTDNAGVSVNQRTERVCAADFNLDGFTDLFLSRQDDHSFFFKGKDEFTEPDNKWVGVRLVSPGGTNNHHGIGARVVITPFGGDPRAQIVDGGKIGPSQGDLDLVFGLGDHNGIFAIDVYWPDGTTQQFFEYEKNRYYTINESAPLIDDQSVTFDVAFHLDTGLVDWIFTWDTITHPGDPQTDEVEFDLTGLPWSCHPARTTIAAVDADVDVSIAQVNGLWRHTLTWHASDCLAACSIPFTVRTGLSGFTSESTGHSAYFEICLQ